jgi:two-component system OmpR family response regulator
MERGMSTVLILDDDQIFRRLMVHELEIRGHRVLQAGRASEADRLVKTERPDFLLVDGLLPDATGVAWIESQRRTGWSTPALFVTSFWKRLKDFQALSTQLGATWLLQKPVAPAAVADQVEALLAA